VSGDSERSYLVLNFFFSYTFEANYLPHKDICPYGKTYKLTYLVLNEEDKLEYL